MTQTILKSNDVPTGKVYPVSDLRTAESIEQICEFVDAGHPIAWLDGGAVRSLQRKTTNLFNCYRALNAGWQHQTIREDTLTHFVKFAPLAYSNGRPLHLENAITFDGWNTQYAIVIADEHPVARLLRVLGGGAWRFAEALKENKKND